VLGTSLHGLFENDSFRAEFLAEVGRRAGQTFVPARVSFAAAREAQIDRMADILEQHADLDSVFALIGDEA
jgi:adenosylcobyric acid synthase